MGPIKLFFSKWVLSNGFHQMGYFEWVLFNVFYSNGFNQMGSFTWSIGKATHKYEIYLQYYFFAAIVRIMTILISHNFLLN